jgi:hypothetical protein
MSELDDFLTPTLARQLEAEKALINGDPGPRLAMWSTQDSADRVRATWRTSSAPMLLCIAPSGFSSALKAPAPRKVIVDWRSEGPHYRRTPPFRRRATGPRSRGGAV